MEPKVLGQTPERPKLWGSRSRAAIAALDNVINMMIKARYAMPQINNYGRGV